MDWFCFCFVFLLWLSNCSIVLFVNIHTCESFIKQSNSVGIFFIFEFAQIWKISPVNQKHMAIPNPGRDMQILFLSRSLNLIYCSLDIIILRERLIKSRERHNILRERLIKSWERHNILRERLTKLRERAIILRERHNYLEETTWGNIMTSTVLKWWKFGSRSAIL